MPTKNTRCVFSKTWEPREYPLQPSWRPLLRWQIFPKAAAAPLRIRTSPWSAGCKHYCMLQAVALKRRRARLLTQAVLSSRELVSSQANSWETCTQLYMGNMSMQLGAGVTNSRRPEGKDSIFDDHPTNCVDQPSAIDKGKLSSPARLTSVAMGKLSSRVENARPGGPRGHGLHSNILSPVRPAWVGDAAVRADHNSRHRHAKSAFRPIACVSIACVSRIIVGPCRTVRTMQRNRSTAAPLTSSRTQTPVRPKTPWDST